MKNKKHKWLIWLNLIVVLPTVLIWAITGLLFRNAGIYIAIIFIPLIIVTYVVLVLDAVFGVKGLYRKLTQKD